MQALSWPVIHGKKLWRTLWFPTINIHTSAPHVDEWTWHVHVLINEKIYTGLWPYFPEKQLFEVHILDFNDSIYEKKVTIFPLKKIRENIKFWSLEELTTQLQKDKEQVIAKPITWITFWTFDIFHPWHAAYLCQAKQRCDILITVIALDETVHRIKWHYPTQDAKQRMDNVLSANISNHVILGDSDDHYACLKQRQPQVICLWYDQSSFNKNLQEFYTWLWQEMPTIVRLDPYKPEKYKSSLLTQK